MKTIGEDDILFELLQLRLVADEYAEKRYYNHENQLHRVFGPAAIYANCKKEWWLNGKCHREDGPAVERSNGSKEWFVDGNRHRTDGPAIELADGTMEWFINNEFLSEYEFLKHPLCTIK